MNNISTKHDRQRALIQEYRTAKSFAAQARLVEEYKPLIAATVYKYQPYGKSGKSAVNPDALRGEQEDLFQAGYVGLLEALQDFDLDCGNGFAVYARHRVIAAGERYARNNHRMVRIGTTDAGRKLWAGANPPGLPDMERELLEEHLRKGMSSLDAPASDADGNITSRVELQASDTPDPSQLYEAAETATLRDRLFAEFGSTLSGFDADIFNLRMLAEDEDRLSHAELAARHETHRSTISRREQDLLSRLAKFLAPHREDLV